MFLNNRHWQEMDKWMNLFIYIYNIPENIEENSILVTFDVENLNSNIPHDLGLEAIEFWLSKYPDELPNRISKEFILDGIKLILENNSFPLMTRITFRLKAQQWGRNLLQFMQHLF